MMNNNLVKILELCNELMIQARLLTAYGNRGGFCLGRQSNWFTKPTNRTQVQYPPFFHHNPLLNLAADDSKLMHFFNRINIKKVHQWQDLFLIEIDKINDNAGNQFFLFKTAHRDISFLLRDVIRFLCATDSSFEQNKKNTILAIEHTKQQFAKHPILHGSHCERILFEIETLITNTQQALYIDRKFDLHCLLMIILFDKTEEQLRIYPRMTFGTDANSAICIAIDNIPKSKLFGYSRNSVVQAIGVVNKNLRSEISAENDKFNKLTTTLMLCYCDALDFIRNSIDYAKGNATAIDFDMVMAETESKLNITKEIRRELVEGELYQELNLQASYQPIFESARRNQAATS